jgi:tetratricopeptide (TPR) repeat protein
MTHFGRADVLRILRISAKQLVGWQRAGLVPTADPFSFSDLLQIKQVRDLRAKKVRSAVIRESLAAMQRQVAGMENPLLEASAFTFRGRVAFRHNGYAVDPVAGQYVMEFAGPGKIITAGPVSSVPPGTVKPGAPDSVHELFAKGVALEENPSNHDEAIRVYLQVLQMNPQHAAAHINIGTLYYNRQDFVAAEKHYRAAVAADPRYALAHFDLGNVLDETGKVSEAVAAYKTAIQLAPTYADAHYNLALAYERLREPRKALRHWSAYIRLDRTGAWAQHARKQRARILEGDKLKLVYKRESLPTA